MREGFNLSAWGLRHGALMAFAMLLSLLGVLAYFKLGRAEDPSLTIKVMTIDVAWPGCHDAGSGTAGDQEDPAHLFGKTRIPRAS
jgi:hypothetical protein